MEKINPLYSIPFPWQSAQWQQFINRANNNNLPHAILIHGASGIGKHLFAQEFAKTLLCQHGLKNQLSCKNCYSCLLIAAGSHPDFFQLVPEEEGKNIRVDKVRELTEKLSQTSQYNGYKICIIAPAHALNVTAANALLKTLEEPAAKTLILLITDQLQQLLPTIRSRCQQLLMPTPDKKIAITWLEQQQVDNAELLCQLAQNAPLRALMISESHLASHEQMFADLLAISKGNKSPVAIAGEWVKISLDTTLEFLFELLADLARLKYNQDANLTYYSQRSILQQFVMINNHKLFALLDQLYKFKTQLSLTNLNQQLVLETLLCSWYDMTGQKTG